MGYKQQNVVVFGESGVGKTWFTDMFISGERGRNWDPTWGDGSRKLINVDGDSVIIDLLDVSATMYHDRDAQAISSLWRHWLEDAQGVILLYDITSKVSFDRITNEGYLNVCRYRKHGGLIGPYRFGCVLVGNKLDIATEKPALTFDRHQPKLTKREVSQELAQAWAQHAGIESFEIDTSKQEPLDEIMKALSRSISEAQRRDEEEHKAAVKSNVKSTAKDLANDFSPKQGKAGGSLSALGNVVRKMLPTKTP